MKTEEDEAFDDLAKKQGDWGGGFKAKQAMAVNKLHWSDCAVHNGPAYPAGLCDCGVEKGQEEDWGALAEKQLASIKRDTQASFEDAMVRATHKVMAEFEAQPAQEPVARVLQIIKELRPAIKPMEGMGKGKTTEEWFDILAKEIERIQPAQQEAIYGINQDDWKDVVAAITKVRDGRGIYLGCRPADVFQEWFLALGTAKVKEKNT
jgi:hypothetical protein